MLSDSFLLLPFVITALTGTYMLLQGFVILAHLLEKKVAEREQHLGLILDSSDAYHTAAKRSSKSFVSRMATMASMISEGPGAHHIDKVIQQDSDMTVGNGMKSFSLHDGGMKSFSSSHHQAGLFKSSAAGNSLSKDQTEVIASIKRGANSGVISSLVGSPLSGVGVVENYNASQYQDIVGILSSGNERVLQSMKENMMELKQQIMALCQSVSHAAQLTSAMQQLRGPPEGACNSLATLECAPAPDYAVGKMGGVELLFRKPGVVTAPAAAVIAVAPLHSGAVRQAGSHQTAAASFAHQDCSPSSGKTKAAASHVAASASVAENMLPDSSDIKTACLITLIDLMPLSAIPGVGTTSPAVVDCGSDSSGGSDGKLAPEHTRNEDCNDVHPPAMISDDLVHDFSAPTN
jgi:hypothetical protein